MMKNLLLLLCLLLGFTASAQTDTTFSIPDTKPLAKDVHTIVEEMPMFPGGEAALLKFLGTNIKYPEDARDCGCGGTLFLTFVVDVEGNIEQPYILKKPKCNGIIYVHPNGKIDAKKGRNARKIDCSEAPALMAKEAVRVIKMMPKWKPGKQNGKAVRVQYNLPIKFTMR